MTALLLAAAKAPHIDWSAFAPFVALAGGGIVVLLAGLLRPRWARTGAVPVLALASLGAAIGLAIWQWDDRQTLISGAMAQDSLTLVLTILFAGAGIAAVLLAWRGRAPAEAGHGEFNALVLFAVFGMAVLVASTNLVTLFLGYELLSIPLYILCAAETRRARSLESGLKYLIVGSVGSATLLYGLAMIYGATGATDLSAIARALDNGGALVSDPLLLTGIALTVAGLAFKASVAPFHQWTPDVYEGAPTPITAFMAVATKAAAFGVLLRLFVGALSTVQNDWAPWLAALATVTIVVGNVGALGQSSLKRLLAYSSVAQAGYLLGGVVAGTRLGVKATVFYLLVYLFMNLAAFAVVVVRERETVLGDDVEAVAGIGATRPWLAWPMTVGMLSLAGIPATAGFIGKIFIIQALVDSGYTWLGVVIVVGSMISLAYYLRVVAAMWMRPAPDEALVRAGTAAAEAGGRPAMAGAEEPDGAVAADGGGRIRVAYPEVVLVAVVAGAASIVFGIVSQPLVNFAAHAASTFGNVF